MNFTQKDIVRLKNKMRQGIDPHPYLIISCEDSISCEGKRHYTGVMLTHSGYKNRFTFKIEKEMIDGSWSDDWSQARAHLLATFTNDDIADTNQYLGKIKKAFFKALLEHINTYVFKVDS